MNSFAGSSERAAGGRTRRARGSGAVRGGTGCGLPRRPLSGRVGSIGRPWVLGGLLAAGAVGCASRARVVPVPMSRPPAEELRLESRDSEASPARSAPLPGAERVYPSQDPRNRVPPGAAEAFPSASALPPGEAAPVQPEVPSPESTASPSFFAPASGTPSARSSDAEAGGAFSVQIFATSSRRAADQKARALARSFDAAPRVIADGGLFKVRVGSFAERAAAESLRRRAFDLGYRDAFVVEAPGARLAGER